ncbi:MAG: succinylglutamate desuccinylase/aspartoacylase family protein [Fulvivirga sp.]|nr:succinylglutamate desuccinylase/aspartoacylase family protein [Fulvivirga sp.]
MTEVFSKALNKSIDIDRIIGHIKGSHSGPTLVFMGGVHGNEPAGVFALHHVFKRLSRDNVKIKGSIYGISGNLKALARGIRYTSKDLNRLWSHEQIKRLENGQSQAAKEDVLEQIEIWHLINKIGELDKPPFYFFDLHTTSCQTIPFLTVNDTILNRKYTSQYPVPMILGIEEYLHGPLLSYINELGYVAFGFEGGQHDDETAILNHEAFIYLTLLFTGCIDKEMIDYPKYAEQLSGNIPDMKKFYEIIYRHEVQPGEHYEMEPGFINFTPVKKGTHLALSNGKLIKAIRNGRVFMPLYQNMGDDGFFIIRSIPKFFLTLSSWMRKLKLDQLLVMMPGISWASNKKSALIVNTHIARFMAKEFFHLLGYRSITYDKTHLIMKKREAASKNRMYEKEPWY